MKYLASANAVANMRRLESEVPATVDNVDETECVDGTEVDAYADSCEWYVLYPDECGWWDTEDFDAVE